MPFADERFRQNATSHDGGGPNRTGTFDAQTCVTAVGRRVLGQPDALASLHRALVVAQAGVGDAERPLASLLLVGPTGVGKTEVVRRVAAALRTGPDDVCRVDMAQLAQEHYAAALSGAPPGYAGSREGSSVLDRERIEGTPLMPGIVLFDEVEKAHPVVLRALLAALDAGTLNPANGERPISFRNALVFLTSNLGSADVARRRSARWRRTVDGGGRLPGLGPLARRGAALLGRRDATAVDRAVRRFFDPEFLNRIDDVVHFGEIAPDTALDIAGQRLEDARVRLRRRGVELHVGPGVAEHLVRVGFDPVHGARSLARAVHREVVAPAARALVEHRASAAGGAVELEIRASDGIVILPSSENISG